MVAAVAGVEEGKVLGDVLLDVPGDTGLAGLWSCGPQQLHGAQEEGAVPWGWGIGG